ncbi:Asparagine synthetase [glutamine-hydrolyzing] 1 [Geobacillus sp. BCO2]|nr:Asparagine synthetase [glutamine-hydrolyzing] 1 [Geobacillus sp. BCO2]
MCGFIGCIHDHPRAIEQTWKTVLMEMNRLITHRGPDDEGYFFDDYVSFGFRRLSIIDLEAGHQRCLMKTIDIGSFLTGKFTTILNCGRSWRRKDIRLRRIRIPR